MGLFMLCICPSYSEEALVPTIVGKVADGHPNQTASAKTPDLPDFAIKETIPLQQAGRRILMKAVTPPDLPEKEADSPAVVSSPLTPEQIQALTVNSEIPRYFAVSATIYDHSKTFVKWTSFDDGQQQQFSAWSNVDWNHLGGFSTFKIGEQQFTYILVYGNSPLEEFKRSKSEGKLSQIPDIPVELPDIKDGGARYALMTGDENNAAAMDFIEGIHELYAQKSGTLEAAYIERERQRVIRVKEAKEASLKKPKDITIHYWPGEGAREVPR